MGVEYAMVTQRELNRYLSCVKKTLQASPSEKRYVLAGLKKDIEEYLAEKADATMADVIACFGTPESTARDYVQNLSADELSRRVSATKCNKRVVLIVLAVVVAIVLVFAVWIVAVMYDSSSQYFCDEIVTFQAILRNFYRL